MLELINKPINENELWLSRYMPLKNFEYWFKEKKLNLTFTRIDLFEDALEGWNSNSKALKESWLQFINFSQRVQSDGGIVEAGHSVISSLRSDKKIKYETTKRELTNFIQTVNTNFASCWFISSNKSLESRYMWNLYGDARNGNAFKLTVKWTDLKKELEGSNINFIAGKINYEVINDDENVFFKKHSSYSHEKEFRIITNDFSNDYNNFELKSQIENFITFNKNNVIDNLQGIITEKTKILNTALPPEIRISDIKKIL